MPSSRLTSKGETTIPVTVREHLAVDAEPWAQQIILAGHSEGTDVVTGALHDDPAIGVAAAGLFASTGSTPF